MTHEIAAYLRARRWRISCLLACAALETIKGVEMNYSGSGDHPQVVNPAKAAWALYIIVFVSGAVLMGLEIAGAKILAPGFGTSTFVWGAIIGMFMGALATGYYVGGGLADKRPSFQMLAGIVSAASVWIILLPR